MLGRLVWVATGTATPPPACLIRSPSLTVTLAPPLFAALIFRAYLSPSTQVPPLLLGTPPCLLLTL